MVPVFLLIYSQSCLPSCILPLKWSWSFGICYDGFWGCLLVDWTLVDRWTKEDGKLRADFMKLKHQFVNETLEAKVFDWQRLALGWAISCWSWVSMSGLILPWLDLRHSPAIFFANPRDFVSNLLKSKQMHKKHHLNIFEHYLNHTDVLNWKCWSRLNMFVFGLGMRQCYDTNNIQQLTQKMKLAG